MKRSVVFVVLLLAGTAVADDEQDILVRLASQTGSEQAWGAYLAGTHGVRDAIPHLTEMIRSVPDRSDQVGRLVVRAAFDALIRLGASVSPGVLAPHLDGYFGVQALILLARSPSAPPHVLLRLFDRQGPERLGSFGIAVGNLLCARGVPGFAARLLRHVQTLHLMVCIVDEGFGGRGGGSRMGVVAGDGRLEVPEGFPPTVLYDLVDRATDGAVLLARGPRAIYWRRTEREGRAFGFGSVGSVVELSDLAREWLVVLSGIPRVKLRLRRTSSTSLIWKDATAYVQHVAAERDALHGRFWALAAALIQRQVLSLEEACALAPTVAVEVHDSRQAPSAGPFPKLPDPPSRPRLPGEPTRPR